MTYAIIDTGGKQVWVELGKFYDINYLQGNPGDSINFHRILFLFNSEEKIMKIGMPCLTEGLIKAKILKHLKGRKLTVFKIKPKKNVRYKKGHRQKLTRVLIEEIR